MLDELTDEDIEELKLFFSLEYSSHQYKVLEEKWDNRFKEATIKIRNWILNRLEEGYTVIYRRKQFQFITVRSAEICKENEMDLMLYSIDDKLKQRIVPMISLYFDNYKQVMKFYNELPKRLTAWKEMLDFDTVELGRVKYES